MRDLSQIKGLLLDMDGVFYVGAALVPGALETLDALRERNIPFRFITNTTTRPPSELLEKLARLGIEARADEIFTAVSATQRYLASLGQPSCYLLVRDSVKPCFDQFERNDHDPDCVVVGDIGAQWDYHTLNNVFNMLMRGSKLVCMHRNKYWQVEDGLRMDIGAFVAALEYVADTEALVIGKPSAEFFAQALEALGVAKEQAAMVGDDIESDIGGAQADGLAGILVKTGKYRADRVKLSNVEPDRLVESIADLPALLV